MNDLLDVKAGLALVENDFELYKTLLEFYLTDNHFDVRTLNDLIMNSKAEAASYIHRIKGASRQIGAKEASVQGQLIEDILKGKTSGNLAPLINNFCKTYNSTVLEIKKYLDIKEN